MAQTVIDEVALREPRLLVPRMQPLSLVTVDKSHPIGQKARFVNLGTPNLIRANLATGLMGTVYGAQVYETMPEGIGARAPIALNQYIEWGSPYVTGTSYTILVHGKVGPNSEGSNNANYPCEISGPNNWLLVIFHGNEYQAAEDGSVTLLELQSGVARNWGKASSAIPDNTKSHVYFLTRDGSTWKIHVDGVDKTTSSNNGVGVSRSALTVTRTIGVTGANLNRVVRGLLVAIFEPALTDAEIKAAAIDPYQFLTPA